MEGAIAQYNKNNPISDTEILDTLLDAMETILQGADAKVWHGHPVWFLEDNPIVGYSIKKGILSILFWSGQSFEELKLKPIGKFKAAEYCLSTLKDLNKRDLNRWLKKALTIQWDYKNLIKRKGVLVRLK